SHTVTAVYGGDANFTGSTAAAVSETVSQLPPPPPPAAVTASVSGPAAGVRGQTLTYTPGATSSNRGPTVTFRVDRGRNRPGAVTASVSGAAAGVRGQTLTYTLGATSSNGGSAFTFRIDWDGNGTVDQTVTGPSGTAVGHTFTASGSYGVRVTAVDSTGAAS